MRYKEKPEIIIGYIGTIKKDLEAYVTKLNNRIPEIKIRINRGKIFDGVTDKISRAEDCAAVLRKYLTKNEIQTQEIGCILYLNRQNAPIGIYVHSKGSLTGTIMDPVLILGTGLKLGCSGIVLCHNHPSGNLTPSKADEDLTHKINNAAKYMDISLLDHIILTKDGYYSFAENGII